MFLERCDPDDFFLVTLDSILPVEAIGDFSGIEDSTRDPLFREEEEVFSFDLLSEAMGVIISDVWELGDAADVSVGVVHILVSPLTDGLCSSKVMVFCWSLGLNSSLGMVV